MIKPTEAQVTAALAGSKYESYNGGREDKGYLAQQFDAEHNAAAAILLEAMVRELVEAIGAAYPFVGGGQWVSDKLNTATTRAKAMLGDE